MSGATTTEQEERQATRARLGVHAARLRRDVVEMVTSANSGHIGGSLSAADIVASLFFHHMRHEPTNPTWADRDRYVQSKGHACPVLYSALAQAGYMEHEEIYTFRKIGSRLQGHPCKAKLDCLEYTTGSLGQGLSGALGMALAAKLDRKDYRVYCLMGDGEQQEGQIWEAAMAAAHYEADNLVAILDRNGLQIDGPTEQILSLRDIALKYRAFGWHVIDIDGHDVDQILDALEEARFVKRRPTLILARTVKGKGISFMEGSISFHGRPPNEDEYKQASEELRLMMEDAEAACAAAGVDVPPVGLDGVPARSRTLPEVAA
ncbi:MAG: transketolase [Thermoplasmatota archaeon]